jgi:cell division protein FtsQ
MRSEPSKQQRSQVNVLPLTVVLVFSAVLVTAVVVVTQYLANPRNLPIKTMAIKGKFRHLDRDNLRRVMSRAIDGGFFTTDIQRIRQAGLSLPWVDDVSITRVWPDKLIMDVTEQQPVARWSDKALVNERGQVFYPLKAMHKWPELQLSGLDGKAPAVLAFYAQINADFVAWDLRIRSLALDERAEWQIELDNGLQIVLGRNDAANRLQRFLRLYGEINGKEQKPVRVDLRYEQGFAVDWQAQNARSGQGSDA